VSTQVAGFTASGEPLWMSVAAYRRFCVRPVGRVRGDPAGCRT